MLYRVGEKVCVDEDGVRGLEGGVVLEEEGGGDLGDFADDFVALGLFGCYFCFLLVLLEAGVSLTDCAFRLGEFAGSFCDAHGFGEKGKMRCDLVGLWAWNIQIEWLFLELLRRR